MNERKSNKVISALTNLSIKVGEQAMGKCFLLVNYEPKLPKELFESR